MRAAKGLALLALAAVFLTSLWGCGSNRSSDGGETAGPQFGEDANGIDFVSTGVCIGCHEGLSFSFEVVDGYLESKHVNHSTTINAASPASCLECHDPIGDGPTIQDLIDPANVPAEGLAAVGCENCHGAGGEHFGIGPIPNFSPDFEVCGKCHKALPDVPGFHPEGLNIIENYRQSAHAEAARTTTPCFRCHSDIGFRTYVDGTRLLDDDNLEEALVAAAPVENAPIQCRTCHDQHKTGTLRVLETQVSRDSAGTRFGTDAEGNTIFKKAFSSQFNLCTACHQAFLRYILDPETGLFTYTLIFDPANPATNDIPFHGSANGPTTAGGRVIWDTHFRFLAADGTVLIPGFNINAADDNACLNCHEVHGTTKFAQSNAVTIANQWASSGHADYLGEPFTEQFTNSICMKCHSGTEYARFVQGVAPASLEAGGGRVIACVGCHDLMAKNAEGEFELGPTREVDAVVFPSGAIVDLGNASNLCAECHQGRSSTPTVNARIAAGNLSFANIHYFAAAATLFGTQVQGGYEYDANSFVGARTYAGRNPFSAHQALGAAQLTDCIGCHLREGAQNHTFGPDLDRCTGCHGGTSFETLGGSPEQNRTDIIALKNQLLDLIVAAGVTVVDGFPYFSNITTAAQLKACYNWQVADKEPCGYIHNGTYHKQILFDSIVDLSTSMNAPATPVVPRP